MSLKVHIIPHFADVDSGEGGIRRVVEAQRKYLPAYGFEIVETPRAADVIAVHATNFPDDLPVGTPVVAHCHGLYWDGYEWEKWCQKANRQVIDVMLKADYVTSVSEWTAQAIRRGTNLPVHVIYHGVDLADWTVGENKGYVLWNKTRPDPICDPEPLNELARRSPETQFITTFGAELSNVVRTDRLPFDQAKELIQHAGVYLCTTRETLGIGTLEAMSCGVPVLGWRWGGQREIITHKVDGYLATPGDDDDLLVGLRYCQERRDELGAAARATVESRFQWHQHIGGYAALYAGAVVEKPKIKVSVVIPAYNMAETLPRAVDSVLNQKKPPTYEIVVVNDASTDETGDVAEHLAAEVNASDGAEYVRVIHHAENQYLAGALNTGIAAARGEYVIPLDADNELGPNALRVLSDALDQDRALDISYGRMDVVEPTGKRWTSDWPPEKASFVEQMKHRNQFPSTSMYRKRVWQRVGGYRRRCRTAEDADFWCRMLSYGARGRRVTTASTLVYHDRLESMSHVEKDWDWTAWYAWSRYTHLTPMAVLEMPDPIRVPAYEPLIVSVVIPVGPGHGKFVLDALDSLGSQTFQRWEAILVFDTTRDEYEATRPLLPSWARTTVLDRASGKNPAAPRNLGAAHAQGRFLLFLDADDYLDPHAIEYMLAAHAEHGGYVYTDWIAYTDGTKEVHQTPDYRCDDVLRQLQHAVTILVEKESFDAIGGFDETLDAWEDWDIIIALNAIGVCGTRVAAPLLYYRTQTGARRDELYVRRDELKENIRAKWRDYIDGGKQLMACGGCKKAREAEAQAVAEQHDARARAAGVPVESATPAGILVEYIGPNVGPVTYRGSGTNRGYRFGRDEAHRVHRVDRQDILSFTNRPEFRFPSSEQLRPAAPTPTGFMEAVGPPARG